jgi:hypothetical protein
VTFYSAAIDFGSGGRQEPNYAVYYRPGDLKGARYQTLEECEQVKDQAENVGVCVLK